VYRFEYGGLLFVEFLLEAILVTELEEIVHGFRWWTATCSFASGFTVLTFIIKLLFAFVAGRITGVGKVPRMVALKTGLRGKVSLWSVDQTTMDPQEWTLTVSSNPIGIK
jgi:hypothetical protein